MVNFDVQGLIIFPSIIILLSLFFIQIEVLGAQDTDGKSFAGCTMTTYGSTKVDLDCPDLIPLSTVYRSPISPAIINDVTLYVDNDNYSV